MYELTVQSLFDAAHFLPGYKGDCNNMHGHTWKIETTYLVPNNQQEETGIAIDFKILKAALNQVLAQFDHRMINQVIPIPTAENIAAYIFEVLKTTFSDSGQFLMAVTVHESRDAKVMFYIDANEGDTNGT